LDDGAHLLNLHMRVAQDGASFASPWESTKMNKSYLPKLLRQVVRIRPTARRTDGLVEYEKKDDEWRVIEVDMRTVTLQIRNTRTDHCPRLGFDQIHSFMTDPIRTTATESHGFLELNVQLAIGGPNGVDVEPLTVNTRRRRDKLRDGQHR
jgi:hypothetical protein